MIRRPASRPRTCIEDTLSKTAPGMDYIPLPWKQALRHPSFVDSRRSQLLGAQDCDNKRKNCDNKMGIEPPPHCHFHEHLNTAKHNTSGTLQYKDWTTKPNASKDLEISVPTDAMQLVDQLICGN